MTSDAKLGLLLGLVLIVAIVFAVNGLPHFAQSANQQSPVSSNTVIRIATEDIMSTARETVRILEEHQNVQAEITPPQQLPVSIDTVMTLQSAQASKPYKEYTVQANENLSVIAKKFYGQEEGNRLVNIEKIAKYNNLKSIDSIYQGQKLKIPSLNNDDMAVLEQTGQFARVSSFNPEPNNNEVRNAINLPTASVISTVNSNSYIVRENDTLWSIASKMLDDGNRYHEILKANSNIQSQDRLVPGMVIKLPNR